MEVYSLLDGGIVHIQLYEQMKYQIGFFYGLLEPIEENSYGSLTKINWLNINSCLESTIFLASIIINQFTIQLSFYLMRFKESIPNILMHVLSWIAKL